MAAIAPAPTSVRERLDRLFQQRIVILDGSMGVMLQRKGLSDEDFRGERFRNHPKPLRNNSDVLILTQPDLVTQVHREYLEAGADIITTNTFTSTRVSQADYGLEDMVYEMNLTGARLACEATRGFENRFVAGWRYPIQLDPAPNDNEERRRWFALSKQGMAGPEIDNSCRGKQVLHHLWIEAAQHSRLTGCVQIIRRRSCHGFNPSVVWTSACFVACTSRITNRAGKDLTQINLLERMAGFRGTGLLI